MANIHVLHVLPTLQAGGIQLALSRIVAGLDSGKVSHAIVVLKGEAAIKDRFPADLPIYCMHAKSDDYTVPLKLRRILRKERPSLIHARNLGAWPEMLAARSTLFPLLPFVFSFHGMADGQPISPRWRLMYKVFSTVTTAQFTVSRASKADLCRHVGIPERQIGIIPNGVDTGRFFPAPQNAPSAVVKIGAVGRLTPVKNHALLVNACAALLRQGVPLALKIAGEGPERPNLEALIRRLQVEEQVHLVGHADDTPAFLNGLDIYAMSSDSEAFPNALVEAMACGLPCIGTAVGGIPEILDDGGCGIVCERRNVRTLADGLQKLIDRPALRAELGARARSRVQRHYSMEMMNDRYFHLYSTLSQNGTYNWNHGE